MYIARAVSKGVPGAWMAVLEMPTLEPDSDAYKAYVAVRRKGDISAFDYSVQMRPRPAPGPRPTSAVVHCARHDAESVYWILLDFLIHALPARSKDGDTSLRNFRKVKNAMTSNEVGAEYDPRDAVISLLMGSPTSILHPALLPMIPFLCEITDMVAPEYYWLKESPKNQFHLHEAMQRLLLREILRINKNGDIKLDATGRVAIEESNVLTARYSDMVVNSGGTKRASAQQGSRGSGSKRKKTEE